MKFEKLSAYITGKRNAAYKKRDGIVCCGHEADRAHQHQQNENRKQHVVITNLLSMR